MCGPHPEPDGGANLDPQHAAVARAYAVADSLAHAVSVSSPLSTAHGAAVERAHPPTVIPPDASADAGPLSPALVAPHTRAHAFADSLTHQPTANRNPNAQSNSIPHALPPGPSRECGGWSVPGVVLL